MLIAIYVREAASIIEGDKLVRLQLYPHKGVSDRTEEFYLMNDKLVFAYIQDKGPKTREGTWDNPAKNSISTTIS